MSKKMDSEDVDNIPPIRFSPQCENHILTKYTIKNPNFFEIDKILNDYITNNSKKYKLFLINCDFELVFNDDFSFHIETDYHQNTKMINLKRYLLNHIEDFINKCYTFSHIGEMNILIVNDRMYMTYDFYLKQPKSMLEWRLHKKLGRNPNLINSLNRFHIQPLIQKYSYFPR